MVSLFLGGDIAADRVENVTGAHANETYIGMFVVKPGRFGPVPSSDLSTMANHSFQCCGSSNSKVGKRFRLLGRPRSRTVGIF